MAAYTLKHPIKVGEKTTIDRLTLRDHVIAEDYLSFDHRGGVAQRIALIASMTGTDEAVIKRLHGADYVALERKTDALMQAAEVEALGTEPKTEAGGPGPSEAEKK